MRTKEELVNEGLIKLGILYETQDEVMVVDEASVDTYDWADISKISRIYGMRVYSSDDVIHIGGYYYLRNSKNYLFINNKYIGAHEIKKGIFSLDEIMDYYVNNPKRAIPENIFKLIKLNLRELDYKYDTNIFSYSPFEEMLPNVSPELWYKNLSRCYDIIFIQNHTHDFIQNHAYNDNLIYSMVRKKKSGCRIPRSWAMISNIISLYSVGFSGCRLLKNIEIDEEQLIEAAFMLLPYNKVYYLQHKSCKDIKRLYNALNGVGLTIFDWLPNHDALAMVESGLKALGFELIYEA